MAIPGSSDGQEVLRRGVILTQSTDTSSFKWDGTSSTTGTESDTVPANHIITVLSIIWCEGANNAEIFNLYGVNDTYILKKQDIAGRETFIWSERLCLKGGQGLKTWLEGAGDVDVFYSYLDQDWS